MIGCILLSYEILMPYILCVYAFIYNGFFVDICQVIIINKVVGWSVILYNSNNLLQWLLNPL